MLRKSTQLFLCEDITISDVRPNTALVNCLEREVSYIKLHSSSNFLQSVGENSLVYVNICLRSLWIIEGFVVCKYFFVLFIKRMIKKSSLWIFFQKVQNIIHSVHKAFKDSHEFENESLLFFVVMSEINSTKRVKVHLSMFLWYWHLLALSS